MGYRTTEIEVQRVGVRSASLQFCHLTQRETEVLRWVSEGKTNVEIGLILEMSPRTVQKHLEHIFRKLGVDTRTAAAAWALVQSHVRRR